MKTGLDLLEQLVEDAKANQKKAGDNLFGRMADRAFDTAELWSISGADDHARECREIAQMLVSVGKLIDACKDKTLMRDLEEVL
jgi:hypothetical protein